MPHGKYGIEERRLFLNGFPGAQNGESAAHVRESANTPLGPPHSLAWLLVGWPSERPCGAAAAEEAALVFQGPRMHAKKGWVGDRSLFSTEG